MSNSPKNPEEPLQWPTNCKICQDIWLRFADPQSTHEVSFGSFEDALSTQCPDHKPLIESFITYIRGTSEPHPEFTEPDSDDLGIIEGTEGQSVELSYSLTKLGPFWSLLLAKNEAVPGHPGTGRLLDPRWADLDILKKWKDICLSTHGVKCHNPMKIWPTRPIWLIDVERKCLVSGQVEGDFVALSYMYGGHPVFHIDADTLAQLQEPYSLETPEISKHVAPVIQHAMYLTSFIGERYLWADALCISHVDPAVTAEQLKMMGAIYASALVTIVAADNDCNIGLTGIEGISRPRDMDQRVIPFGNEKLILRNTTMFSLSGWGSYFDRGWTYQEYKMSQRRIHFNNKELHWECQCSVFHEEMVLGAEVDKYIDPRLSVILAGFPNAEGLAHLLTSYNETQLRYDEDVLPAISGLLSVMSRSFTGGFLYGLPEMFFEIGLRWKPMWSHINLRRRTPSDKPPENHLTPSGLPSWSWVGWQGLFAGNNHEAARVNPRSHEIEETIPITEWYTSLSPSDPPPQRRRIRSSWFENRDSYKDFTKPLPPGWTRHDAPVTAFRDEPWLYPDGCEKYIFTHTEMSDPDEDTQSWYYPFPVPDIQESTPPFTPEQTPYLFCETKTARLFGHQAGDNNIITLRNTSGKVGSLHLHNDERLALFPKTLPEDEKGYPVELVAISKMKHYSKTWNEEKQIYDLPLNKNESYVVLWVEWEDGVANRVASGEVDAPEWEKLDLKDVSLVLG